MAEMQLTVLEDCLPFQLEVFVPVIGGGGNRPDAEIGGFLGGGWGIGVHGVAIHGRLVQGVRVRGYLYNTCVVITTYVSKM